MKPFNETQRFTQWWLWLLLIAIGLFHFYLIYEGLDNDERGSSFPVLVVLSTFSAIVLFVILRLDTKVDAEGVHYRFFPFQLNYKLKKWDEIEKANVRQYKPIYEYGGWGIRGWGKDKARNVSGNMGLQLELKNGDKLLIGTQKGEEIEKVVKGFRKDQSAIQQLG